MTRSWRSLSLAAALLFVQFMLAVHGIGHAFEHDEADADGEVCIECLVLAGTHGAPPPASLLPVPLATAAGAPNLAVPPPPTFARPTLFLTRAPPMLRS